MNLVEWLATKHKVFLILRNVLAEVLLFLLRSLRSLRSLRTGANRPVETEPFNPEDFRARVAWTPPPRVADGYDVVVVIAFLGRLDVLRFIVSDMCDNVRLGLGIVLACSEPEDEAFCIELQKKYHNIGYVRCPNRPLGSKWQCAVDHARVLNPATLMIVGSDDYVTPDFIENNVRFVANGGSLKPALAGPRTWYMVSVDQECDTSRWKVWRVSYKNSAHLLPLGAGRIYSRQILDTIDWKLFDCRLNALLDGQGYKKVVEANGRVYNTVLEDGAVVSVKGSWGALNSKDKILAAETIICTEQHGDERARILSYLRPLYS